MNQQSAIRNPQFAWRVRACAKINLSLRVLGTRPDGFHELRTIFQSIALHDTLTIRRWRGPFRLTCDDPACPAGEANLIWRAATRVWKAAGRRGAPRDVAVGLQKRIAMNAGLGGGSSDAAAAVRAFAALWGVDDRRARAIAADLGADVPYFFEGGTVLGLERGDLLFPLLDRPPAWVVLVLPDFGVSTREAFGWWDGAQADRSAKAFAPRSAEALALRSGKAFALRSAEAFAPRSVARSPQRLAFHEPQLVNDLEPVVCKHHPEIARIVSRLRTSGASHAAMTGSGSTVFGLFETERRAAAAARALESRAHRPQVTRTLTRAQYQRLARI